MIEIYNADSPTLSQEMNVRMVSCKVAGMSIANERVL